MNSRKSLSFHALKPKSQRPCYSDICNFKQDCSKGARVYDFSNDESPLMRCIRKNLLFPRRYHSKTTGKKSILYASNKGFKSCSSGNDKEKWKGYGIMKETFHPKVRHQDMIKRSLDLIEKTMAGLTEIESRKEKLKDKAHEHKSQELSNILDEMEHWF